MGRRAGSPARCALRLALRGAVASRAVSTARGSVARSEKRRRATSPDRAGRTLTLAPGRRRRGAAATWWTCSPGGIRAVGARGVAVRAVRAVGSRSPSRLRRTLSGRVACGVARSRRARRVATTRTRRRRTAVSASHEERLRAFSLEAPRHAGEARESRIGSNGVPVAVEGRAPAAPPASGHAREAGESRRRGRATKHGRTTKHGRHALEHRRHTPIVVIAHEVGERGVQTAHGRAVTTRATAVTRRAARRPVAVAAGGAVPSVRVRIAVTTEPEGVAGHDCEFAEKGWVKKV